MKSGFQMVEKMLGWKSEEFAHQTLVREQEFADSFSEVSALAHKFIVTLEIYSNDTRAVYACALFARLMQSSEAVACLSAYGYTQEAAALVRAAFEAFLKLAAVCEQPELAERALNAELIEERKIIDAALARDSDSRTDEDRRLAIWRRDQIKQLEFSGEIDRLDRRSLAKEVNQLGLYDTVFRLTSRYVHPSLKALEEFIVRGEDGKPEGVRIEPRSGTFQIYVHTVLDFLLKGLTYLGEFLQLEPPEGYSDIVDRYRRLEPKWPDGQD